MKNNRTLLFTLIIILGLIEYGCKGDAGPAGPSLHGDIFGYCYLYDSTQTKLTNHSGAVITIEGTPFSATTQSDGRFFITGLSTGTYTILFQKAGYGTYKRLGYQLVGGGLVFVGSADLFELPRFQVTNLTANTAGGSINIVGTLSSNADFARQVIVFAGTSPFVSSDPSTYLTSMTSYVSSGSSTFLAMFDHSYFSYYGFNSGQTLYLVAYGSNGWNSYQDYATLKYVFPNLSKTPSNVVTVVVP